MNERSAYRDREVVVAGLGATGLSLARWLSGAGARVRVADTRADPPGAAQLRAELGSVPVRCGPFDEDTFAGCDLIALSPGLDRREPALAAALARGVPVVGDIELFARHVREVVDARLVAVTGTNGKSTVAELTGAMLARAGLATVVAGNIGRPALDALAAAEAARRERAALPQAFVLEVSSFQLESTTSLDADAATVLNLSEDHLDRYDGLSGYAAAKARIFSGGGVQVLNREDRWSSGMALPGRAVVTFGLDAPPSPADWGVATAAGGAWLARGEERLLPVSEVPIPGRHNVANALAALALASALGLPAEPLLAALRTFRGLPHRVQPIADLGGVLWYDDSKGTNVGATVAALSGFPRPVVLIAGGDGKGQDFAPLAAAVASGVRAVILIGVDALRLAAVLAPTGVPVTRAASLEQAVQVANSIARPGDAVLLSPACASLDMFRNYVHRAEVFLRAVAELDQSGPDGRPIASAGALR
jgi:UDP-N-acetylmuramoylalanine--D-glutamate ligase